MGSKGTTSTQTTSLPGYESAGIQNLLGQANTQTNQDISNINAPGLTNQIQANSTGILGNQVNSSALTSPLTANANSNWTQPGVAQSYISPYENTALASQVNLDQQNVLAPEQAANARSQAASGALGGSRAGIQNAMTNNQFNAQEMNQIAQGENTAYQTGEQQYNADQSRNLAANTQAANTGISAANSNTYNSLASNQGLLQSIQAGESPEQQLQSEAGIYGSVPSQATTTGTQTQNAASVWGGVVSGLLGGAGDLLTGIKAAKGGLIKLAEGGPVNLNARLADYLRSLDLHDVADQIGA